MLVSVIGRHSGSSRDRDLAAQIPAGPWLDWAARLVPAVAIEAIIAWLDAGQPDAGQAAGRIGQVIHGAIQAAQPLDWPP